MSAVIQARIAKQRDQLTELDKRIATLTAKRDTVFAVLAELEAIERELAGEPVVQEAEPTADSDGGSNAAIILSALRRLGGWVSVDDIYSAVESALTSSGSKRNLVSTTLYNAKKRGVVEHDSTRQLYRFMGESKQRSLEIDVSDI